MEQSVVFHLTVRVLPVVRQQSRLNVCVRGVGGVIMFCSQTHRENTKYRASQLMVYPSFTLITITGGLINYMTASDRCTSTLYRGVQIAETPHYIFAVAGNSSEREATVVVVMPQ